MLSVGGKNIYAQIQEYIVTLLSSLSFLISYKTISSEITLIAHDDSYAMKKETNLRPLDKSVN